MKKYIKIVSNLIFIAAVILAGYTLMNIYFINKGLPPGVCPVDNNRPLIYTAIALSLVSFILISVEGKINKNK